MEKANAQSLTGLSEPGLGKSTTPQEFARGDYPRLSQVAAEVAGDGQGWHMRFILIELGSGFAAASAGALLGMVTTGFQIPTACFAAVALLAAIVAQVVRRRSGFDRMWFEGRAARESTKTATWRYMMRAPPFTSAAESEQEFAHVLAEVLESSPAVRQRLAEMTGDPEIFTERMRQERGEDWRTRRELYVEQRLNDQIKYYRDKATSNARRGRWFLWASVGAQVLAISTAWLRVMNTQWNLVAVCTTLAASFLAWSQSKRFDELEVAYQLAYDELNAIKQRISDAKTEDEFITSVLDAEGAISREHTMWVAKRRTLVHRPIT